MLYLWVKVIHILSSTLLFGTGLASAYYMYRAHLSGHLPSIVYAARAVVVADWVFTMPAVIIQPITGFYMVFLAGYSFTSLWIILSIGLYLVAGACWLPVVWLQIKVKQIAEQSIKKNMDLPPHYYTYMRYWFLLGWPAFIAVMITFYLMVFKPA